jgi:ribonuclease R
LYRVHDEPDVEKLEEYRSLLDTFHIKVRDLTNARELVRLLEVLRTHPARLHLAHAASPQSEEGRVSPHADGHFGLHKKDYTHFTSPIRRYADLVVHRVFEHYLVKHAGQPAPAAMARLRPAARGALGEHLSLTEVNSAEAERDSVKVKLLEYFEREVDKYPKTRFAAVITDVRPNGFFIELVESMTFGFVSASSAGDDYYSPNTAGNALIGRKRKKTYAVNGRLDVRGGESRFASND